MNEPVQGPYFNPDDYEFNVVGFYEELIDTTTAKAYGVRLIQEPDRPLGSPGRIQYTFTSPVTLRKGVNEVVIKASLQRPIKVWAMLQAICGSCKRSTK